MLPFNMAGQEDAYTTADKPDGGSEAKPQAEGSVGNETGHDAKLQPAVENPSQSKKSAKKKKKGKKMDGAGVVESDEQASGKQGDAVAAPAAVNMQTIRQIQKAMEQLMAADKPARTRKEAKQRTYHFWDTQPVPKIGRPCFCAL